MPRIKPSHFLAALAWVSVFMEAWLLLKNNILFGWMSVFFFVFFLVVAVGASVAASDPKKEAK